MEILKYLETIISDKELENETITYFNLNPDWYNKLHKECEDKFLPIVKNNDVQYKFETINIAGKEITIDCRGWENKWGGWYFECDITNGNNYIFKDIMFSSKYETFWND